jgi:hypothetical protein
VRGGRGPKPVDHQGGNFGVHPPAGGPLILPGAGPQERINMGSVLRLGGLLGAVVGVEVVKTLREIGFFDLVGSISYVAFPQ